MCTTLATIYFKGGQVVMSEYSVSKNLIPHLVNGALVGTGGADRS